MDFWTLISYCVLMSLASVTALLGIYLIAMDIIDKVDEVRRLKNGSEEEN